MAKTNGEAREHPPLLHMSRHMYMSPDLPCDLAELTDPTAQVVKEMKRPAIDPHGKLHVVNQVLKQQLVLL